MARRDYAPTGRLDNMLKDLDGVQALARATLTALPVTAIVAEIHRAFVAAGLGRRTTLNSCASSTDPAIIRHAR